MSISSFMRLSCLGIALLTLGCGGDRTEQLIAQLEDTDLDVRRTAIKELASCEDEKATAALATVVDDQDTDVRRLAIDALGRRGSRAAAQLPSIQQALEDPQLSVRLAAALAIQSIDPESEAFVPVLIGSLRAGEGGIFLEVAEMGPDAAWAVPTLVQLLSHPDTKIRRLTAITLGRLGPTAGDAQSALTRALKDPHRVVRDAAQQALELIDAAPASEP